MYRSMILIACLALLSGCSRTELVYRNADWLAYRWADKLLDADQSQSEQWPLWFEQVMGEHRREALPQVVLALQAASIHVDRGLTVEGLECLWQDANRLIEAHAHLIAPTVARVLAGISPEQVDHLRAALEERNAEYRETYLHPDPNKREVERVARFTARIERWAGELSAGQQRLVGTGVRRIPDVAEYWLRYREQQQKHLMELLRGDPDSKTLERFLVAWWVEQTDRGPELIDAYPRMRDGWIRMLAALDETLDDDQRTGVVARISNLRNDLAGEIVGRVDLASPMQPSPPCSALL